MNWPRPGQVDRLQADVARIALVVAGRHGFALGGGVALVDLGVLDRPTEDVDLFTDTDGGVGRVVDQVEQALTDAGYQVQRDPVDTDLGEIFEGFDDQHADLTVTHESRSIRLSLGRMDRHHRAAVGVLGPVLALPDLAGCKVAALVNRREPRDYVDVAALLLRGYTLAELLSLARQAEPGMDQGDVDSVRYDLDRMPASFFARYGLDAEAVAAVRAAFQGWPQGAAC